VNKLKALINFLINWAESFGTELLMWNFFDIFTITKVSYYSKVAKTKNITFLLNLKMTIFDI